MTSAFAFLFALTMPSTPLDTLKEVRAHYQGLKTFSMRIEHQNSSGLFPGKYSQTLRWRKGGLFELVVTDKNTDSAANKAPDYSANGNEVSWISPGNRWETRELAIQPGTAPGWEVSGGMIMSWLQNTETGKMLFDPPKGFNVDWSFGPRTEWRSQRVREILGKMKSGRGVSTLSLFVDEAQKALIGFEYSADIEQGKKQQGYALYTGQKFNPELPATLGNPPATRK